VFGACVEDSEAGCAELCRSPVAKIAKFKGFAAGPLFALGAGMTCAAFSRFRVGLAGAVLAGSLSSASGLAAQPVYTLPLPPGGAIAPPPPAARLLYGEAPIPANGALLLTGVSGLGSPIQVVNASGQTLSGTSTQVEGNVVWKPDAPLTPGETITVTLSPASATASGQSNVYKVPVTPARTPLRPALSATLSVERSEQNDMQCCNVLPGFMSPVKASCFPTEAMSFIAMTVVLTNTVLSSDLNQFLFKLSVPAAMAPGSYLPLQGSYPFRFQTVADQYCFDVEAIDIASMQTFKYADLMPRCKPHGDLGTIGTRPIDVAAAALAHEVCMVPPPLEAKQWCDLNDSACSSNRAAPGCEDFGPLCKGEPALPPPNAGASGARAAAGSGGDAARAGAAGLKSVAGTAGAAGVGSAAAGSPSTQPFEQNVQHSTSGGCSALHGQRGAPLWFLLGLSLWLLRLRHGHPLNAARRRAGSTVG
jgi:hypothetical protein